MSDLNAAYLSVQLAKADKIYQTRMQIWDAYAQALEPLAKMAYIDLQKIPQGASHNAHLFYLKVRNQSESQALIDFLSAKNIQATRHYVPLHTSEAGEKFGVFSGEDKFTTQESQRLVRLPIYYGMEMEEVAYVVSQLKDFFNT